MALSVVFLIFDLFPHLWI